MHFSLGWLDAAIEIDYTNKSMDRQGQPIKYIILHGTAGGSSAQAIGEYFRDSNVDASAHIIIDQNGNVVQGIPLSLAAWSNGPITGTPTNLGFRTAGDGVHRDAWWNPAINPNLITVSIEHCKNHNDNSDQLTPIQQETSFKVIKTICDTYNIPPHFADASGGITGHFSMDPINRSRCPGPYDWDGLFTFLGHPQQEETLTIDISNPTVASYFTQLDAQHWQCKSTGFIIQQGILDFYKSYGGDALCGLTYLGLPTGSETPVPGKQGVVTQEYERGTVAYDPAHVLDNPPGSGPVYVMHRTPIVTPSKSIIKALSDLAACSVILQTVQHDLAS